MAIREKIERVKAKESARREERRGEERGAFCKEEIEIEEEEEEEKGDVGFVFFFYDCCMREGREGQWVWGVRSHVVLFELYLGLLHLCTWVSGLSPGPL